MTCPTDKPTPFDLNPRFKNPLVRACFGLVRPSLERMLGLRYVADVWRAASEPGDPAQFLDLAMEASDTRYSVSPQHLQRIPVDGPLVVVANHPYGALEGFLLLRLLEQIRPDVRAMTNFLLSRIPELTPRFIPVDPFGGPNAVRAEHRAAAPGDRVAQWRRVADDLPGGVAWRISIFAA